MKVTIVAAAFGHLDEGYDWYEHQEQGAGDYFLRTMLSEITALILNRFQDEAFWFTGDQCQPLQTIPLPT